mmetsp:Transcript_17338/g.42127  ORF Transcript_17338/g.42127 Transcript_17338/m.42127 type:complete len:463 (-) Transcript_17338:2631-4019(-)
MRLCMFHAMMLLLLHESDHSISRVLAASSSSYPEVRSPKLAREKIGVSTSEFLGVLNNDHDDDDDELSNDITKSSCGDFGLEHQKHDDDNHIYINYNNHEMILRGLGDDDLCPFSFPEAIGLNDDTYSYYYYNERDTNRLQDDEYFHLMDYNLAEKHRHNRVERIIRRLKAEHHNHTTYQFSLVPVVSVLIPRLLSFGSIDNNNNNNLFKSDQCITTEDHIAAVDDLTGRWKPVVTTDFLNELDNFWVTSCKAKQDQQNKSSDPMCTASTWYRRVVLRGVSFQRELIRHLDDDIDGINSSNGQTLELVATNPITSWNRTLHSSPCISSFEDQKERQGCRKQTINHLNDPRTNETISTVAFWSSDGNTHTSILWYNEEDVDIDDSNRPLKLVVEEIFPRWETKRYLLHHETDPAKNHKHQPSNDVLMSESILHYHNNNESDPSDTSNEDRSATVSVLWTYVRD